MTETEHEDLPTLPEIEKVSLRHRDRDRIFYRVNGSWIERSRYIIEHHLHRQLRPDEYVHHINGNTTDDRIENLEVLSPHDHHSRHQPGDGCIITKMVGKYGPYRYHVKKVGKRQIWTYLGKATDSGLVRGRPAFAGDSEPVHPEVVE